MTTGRPTNLYPNALPLLAGAHRPAYSEANVRRLGAELQQLRSVRGEGMASNHLRTLNAELRGQLDAVGGTGR